MNRRGLSSETGTKITNSRPFPSTRVVEKVPAHAQGLYGAAGLGDVAVAARCARTSEPASDAPACRQFRSLELLSVIGVLANCMAPKDDQGSPILSDWEGRLNALAAD